MKLELRPGYQALLEMRKTTANQSHKIHDFILNSTLKNTKNAFVKYFDVISSEEKRQFERRSQHWIREKIMFKAVNQVEKTFKKGIEGKFKVDILTQLAHFVNEETTHQEYLKTYGKGVLPLRQTFIAAER